MPDNYLPQFQHQDWLDNVDLVSAEDPVKGFNKRFKDLRLELDQISRIIGQINSSLAPPTTTLTFAPNFSANGSATPWTVSRGIASKGTSASGAEGWFAVQLPQGSRVQSMAIMGDKSGNVGSFTAQFLSQGLTGGEPPPLLSINLATESDSFQTPPQPIPAAENLIANQTNKYIVSVRIIGADPASSARIFAIQFVCTQA
jgi:hypothetical protein